MGTLWQDLRYGARMLMKKSVITLIAVGVVVCLSLFRPSPLHARSKQAVTIEDLLTLQSAGWLELSPDGQVLVYAKSGQLWRVATTRDSAPRLLRAGIMPRFAPGGQRLLFLAAEAGVMQMWVMNSDGGEAVRLTGLAHGVNQFSPPVWSPDGRYIAFTANQSVAPPHHAADDNTAPTGRDAPLILTNDTAPSLTLGGLLRGGNELLRTAPPRRVSQLFVLDVASGQTQQLTRDELSYAAPSWSPDNRTLVCVAAHPRSSSAYRPARVDICTINVANKERRLLVSFTPTPGGASGNPHYSPDGARVAYLAPATIGGHDTLFVAPVSGGRALDVAAKLDRSVQACAWAESGRALIVTMRDGVSFQIVRLALATSIAQPLTSGAALRRNLSMAATGALAWQQSDPTGHGVLWFKPARGDAYALVDLNPQIKEWALGAQEVVNWRNKWGESLEGILIKPLGYRQGHTYPLIVDPYGNLLAVNDFKGIPNLANQSLAARGYAVFFPGHRAFYTFPANIKNTAHIAAARQRNVGDVVLDDVLSGVDALVARGIADERRLGLLGASNGASVVNYLITRTDRFRAAVSQGGVSDWLHYFLLRDADDWTIPDSLQGRTPWTDRATYLAASPLYHLDKVKTPLLLVVGDRDQRALDHIYLYQGLRRLEREVKLVRYPEEGHVILASAALKDYWTRVNEFFDERLGVKR